MAYASLTVRVDGMANYQERLNERIAAFEKAAEELAEMIPGKLEIQLNVTGHRKTDGILEWMKERGMDLKFEPVAMPKEQVRETDLLPREYAAGPMKKLKPRITEDELAELEY